MECGTNLMYTDVRFNRVETVEFQKVHARIRDALKTFRDSKFRDVNMYVLLQQLDEDMQEFEKKAIWNVD
jgi:hypothetical protein